MVTPIEQAREDVYTAFAQLPGLGLRNDQIFRLKRYAAEAPGNELSMDPALKPSASDVRALTITAAKIKLYTGPALYGNNGGVIRGGDHIFTFPRAAAIEAFLKQRIAYPTRNTEALYPEMELCVFELDGIDYRPIRWEVGAIQIKVWARRVNGP